MVLRKERIPKSGTSSNFPSTSSSTTSDSSSSSIPVAATMSSSNEQPVKKRQKIDVRISNSSNTSSNNNDKNGSSEMISSEINTIHKNNLILKPDILVVPSTSSIISSSSNKIINNNIPNSITSSPTSSHNSSTDEVDKCILQITSSNTIEISDLLRTNNHCSTTTSSSSSIGISSVGNSINNNFKNNNNNSGSSSTNSNNNCNDDGNEMAEFEEYLIKQCLCGVNEITLRKPFESHYSHDIINGTKRIVNLNEWPISKLIKFLSNLQLLFDIYLKQNNKGFICSRIMDICDALIRNDHNLIDEIIDLANYNNKYIQFLSGRVLASFLVISKNNMDDNWLKKLVDNLFLFDHMDFIAIRKIQFTLEIIKRIVEWKDIDIHPLDEEIDNRNIEITNQQQHHQQQQQTLENNYFARNFIDELERNSNDHNNINISSNSMICASSSSSSRNCNSNNSEILLSNTITKTIGCQLITLTDSESFDTTHLKCITIKILENKWPALVKNMSNLISTYRDVINAENCILTFLYLWENIISVKANLSIVETLPFYAQLDKFELLLNHNLSCTIYKQMLSLFNESLCYGSTLALQDLLPEETCMLAHQIVRHVKDYRILDSLPRRQPENILSLIGYKGPNIKYELNSIYRKLNNQKPNHKELMELNEIPDMDKIILQKIVLLVLKSVAITVKEIRSDSSDSSIDSTDYDAFQDMVLIERSIRDVLKKLELFIKTTLEFHPDCHFSKILIHLFDDQDDHLIESMVCTLDVTSGISFRNNAFPELVSMLNPVLTFLEFLKMISNSTELLLDLLVSNETCFLLYLLRFLKYIRINWSMFVSSCEEYNNNNNDNNITTHILDDSMTVLIRLRLQISRLVSKQLYPYDISPVLRLLESCESLYEGNELS